MDLPRVRLITIPLPQRLGDIYPCALHTPSLSCSPIIKRLLWIASSPSSVRVFRRAFLHSPLVGWYLSKCYLSLTVQCYGTRNTLPAAIWFKHALPCRRFPARNKPVRIEPREGCILPNDQRPQRCHAQRFKFWLNLKWLVVPSQINPAAFYNTTTTLSHIPPPWLDVEITPTFFLFFRSVLYLRPTRKAFNFASFNHFSSPHIYAAHPYIPGNHLELKL